MFIAAKIAFVFTSLSSAHMYDFHIFTVRINCVECRLSETVALLECLFYKVLNDKSRNISNLKTLLGFPYIDVGK